MGHTGLELADKAPPLSAAPRLPVPLAAHVAILVRDVELSRNFYVETLGFTDMLRLERDGRLWLAYLRVSEDQILEICAGDEDAPGPLDQPAIFPPLRLGVPDIDLCMRGIQAAGIYLHRPLGLADNDSQCWVRDPDDRPVQLIQMERKPSRAPIARMHTN